MRDYRNEFIQYLRSDLNLIECNDDIKNLIIAKVSVILDKYELTERETAIVPLELMNTELIKTYANNLLLDGKSVKTIKYYAKEILKFSQFLNHKDLTTVCIFDIRNYLSHEKVRGVSNSTLENKRSSISAFYSWLVNNEYIDKNPCLSIKPIRIKNEVRLPFTTVELDKLRSGCQNKTERAIVEFLFASGVRISELTALNVEDVDFIHKSVHVKNGKGNKERYTYINDVACEHLIRYLLHKNIESGALFVSQRGRYTDNGVRTMLCELAKRSGVTNVHPHRFRRTFATTLAARGMNIQEIQQLMGHTNINTTMVYITLSDVQVNLSYNRYIS